MNTTTHSYSRTAFTYSVTPQLIDEEAYWKVLGYGDYKLGIPSRSTGLLFIYSLENEKLATFYGKLSTSTLVDACVSDKFLYFATYSPNIVQRIELDDLIEDMTNAFF